MRRRGGGFSFQVVIFGKKRRSNILEKERVTSWRNYLGKRPPPPPPPAERNWSLTRGAMLLILHDRQLHLSFWFILHEIHLHPLPDEMKSFIAKRVISILVNLRYLRFKLLKYRENNKKMCNTFDHNFKNNPL